MTVSLHDASVGVYVPFLRNLSGLLDHASVSATARKIDPEVLLALRLAPNMYNLRQQIDEANRHVVLSCALLACLRMLGRDPLPIRQRPIRCRLRAKQLHDTRQERFCQQPVTLGREMMWIAILPRKTGHFLVLPYQNFDPPLLQRQFDGFDVTGPYLIRNALHAIIAAWLENNVRRSLRYFLTQHRKHLICSFAGHPRIDDLNVVGFGAQ
jgi:hypothetical protein